MEAAQKPHSQSVDGIMESELQSSNISNLASTVNMETRSKAKSRTSKGIRIPYCC